MTAIQQHNNITLDRRLRAVFVLLPASSFQAANMKKKLAHDVLQSPCFPYSGLTPVFPVCHFVEDQSIAANHLSRYQRLLCHVASRNVHHELEN
jgi:hypothetical protein